MFTALGSKTFYICMQNEQKLAKGILIFIGDMPPRVFPMFVKGSHAFAMFSAHEVRGT